MRKSFVAALVGAVLCAAAPALAAGERIVVITNAEAGDAFWSVLKHGVDDAAKDANVEAEFFAPDKFDPYKMNQMIEAAVASRADGIIVSLADPAGMKDAIDQVVGSGIPVIAINSGLSAYKQLGIPVFVGQSSYDAAVAAGERLAKLGVKKAVCANQEITNTDLAERCAGFKKGLGGDVSELDVGKDTTEVKNRLLAFMQSHPGTDGVLATGSSAASGVLALLDQEDVGGKLKTASFDLSPDILTAIDKGKMEFAVDQQQYLQGYLSVVLMSRTLRYGMVTAGVVPTGPGFVTKATAAKVVDLSKQGLR